MDQEDKPTPPDFDQDQAEYVKDLLVEDTEYEAELTAVDLKELINTA